MTDQFEGFPPFVLTFEREISLLSLISRETHASCPTSSALMVTAFHVLCENISGASQGYLLEISTPLLYYLLVYGFFNCRLKVWMPFTLWRVLLIVCRRWLPCYGSFENPKVKLEIFDLNRTNIACLWGP